MIPLIASFFSLFVGPLVYQTFGPLHRTDQIVNGIVLVVVSGIIATHVLPEAYEAIGFYALLIALIGFAGPTLIERTFHKAADTTHKLTIFLGIAGLLIHAFMDGAALQSDQADATGELTLAIIIHRLPVGLTIWWLLKPLVGERYALLTLFLMGVMTIAGFIALEQSLPEHHNNHFFALFKAFIAGSLLHVIIHKPHSDGCMHTSKAHNHNHHAKPIKSKGLYLGQLLLRWDVIGGISGLLLLLLINLH